MDDNDELNRIRETLRKTQNSLEEEQRLREDEQRLRKEEQRRREEEQRLRKEEQRRREEEREEEQRLREEVQQLHDRQVGKTAIPDFLNACHTHLCLGLNVQRDMTKSTQGSASNADRKLRPKRIRLWSEFAQQQAAIWEDLMQSDFIEERSFTSLHTLEEVGGSIRRRLMSSELDLHQFARQTVHDPVTMIIKQLWKNPSLRVLFDLKGSVEFENHANMLSPDRAWELSSGSNILEMPRRRSPRLNPLPIPERAPSVDSAASVPSSYSSRPRADQFCVYNISRGHSTEEHNSSEEHKVAAFVVEYKPPHKLTLRHIYEGLGDMDVDDVVRADSQEDLAATCRRFIAAIITQAFSYMIHAGLEFGYVFTGEAFIFLRIPDDPSTVYYFLSVPKADVGPTTDWNPDVDQPNRLHLTAVGQALAFTLRALRGPPRTAKWRADAQRSLETWEVVVEDLYKDFPKSDEPTVPSSEYRPEKHEIESYARISPIRLRNRTTIAGCSKPAETILDNGYGDTDDDYNSNTPSQQAPANPTISSAPAESSSSKKSGGNSRGLHRQRNLGPFCTSSCLLGLMHGATLDRNCPNVVDHEAHHSIARKDHHPISHESFLDQMRDLFENRMDYCETMYVHGSRGALFRAKLPLWGYTVAVKGTGIECANDLRHESEIYERLQPIQGRYVPVHLGSLNLLELDRTFYYVGAVEIVHVMFLSFEGFPASSTTATTAVKDQAIRGIEAIHALGVLHQDVAFRNLLLRPGGQQPIWHDFERAVLLEQRTNLGDISPNRKRRGKEGGKAQVNSNVFRKELQRAEILLRVPSTPYTSTPNLLRAGR